MRKHLVKRLLCIALSAVMITSSPVMALAEEYEEQIVLTEEDTIADENDEVTVEENEATAEEVIAEENEVTAEESEDASDEENESVSDEEAELENEADEVALDEESEAALDEEILTEDTEAEYVLSENEKELKEKLASEIEHFDSLTEGTDYLSGSVYRVLDTNEEAQSIAEKYGATLSSYEYGVAVFALAETMSVSDAIHLAADTTNDYPVVYPDYISKGTGLTEEVVEEADILKDNDSFNQSNFSGTVLDENGNEIEITNDGLSVFDSQVIQYKNYDDPFLEESSTYYQWHHELIGSPYAWAKKITGKGIRIAILSTGINSHYDISTSSIKINSDVTDASGDGTFIAGILVENLNNNEGGAGICPDADIYNYRINKNSVSSAIAAINKAADASVDIIVLDYMIDFPISDLEEAVDYAYSCGSAIFAGVANTGEKYDCWPAAYNHVISVAATDKSNVRAAVSSNSSNTDFGAPGTFITSCSSSDVSKYRTLSGSTAAATVAAGEAALILSNMGSIPALKDKKGNFYYGSQRVDALKKLMQASTIPAGAGTGKGIVYVPKALGIGTVTTAPDMPEIDFGIINKIDDRYILPIYIKPQYYDCQYLLYTTDGKKPSYKNGVKDKYSEYLVGEFFEVDIADVKTDVLTVNAIAVNSLGVSSKVAVAKLNMTDILKEINISAPSNKVSKGKTVKMSADIIPCNSKTKPVTWHVSYFGNEALAKRNGVTVSTAGVVSVDKTATAGSYMVWAVSKLNSSVISNYYTITVVDQVIKTIKPTVKTQTAYRDYYDVVVDSSDLFNMFEITKVDGTAATESDVYYTSSNPDVIGITSMGAIVKAPGKAVISACAVDTPGVKGNVSVTVIQNATYLKVESDGYDKVAVGKTLTLKPVTIGPDNSKVKKVSSWEIDDAGKAAGVKVVNGKVITTKNSIPGTYRITANVNNPDGSIISNYLNIEVIPEVVKKVTIDKNAQTFRSFNMFSATTSTTIHAKVEGGKWKSGKPDPKAYSITSSNPSMLYIAGSTYNSDGTIDIGVTATGTRSGKVNVTIQALDGSGLKAVCSVNVVNPVSSVGIAPAKAGVDTCVAAGKTLALKATFGTEYGPISNKKVKWNLDSDKYATISQTGVITAKATAPNNTRILVTAEALDGSGAGAARYIFIYKNVGKMEITDNTGKPIKNMGIVTESADQYNKESVVFYVKVKDPTPYGFSNFRLSSSNPKCGTIRHEAVYIEGTDYVLYKFAAIGYKSGTTTLKVMTKDGSQSVSYTLKVNK